MTSPVLSPLPQPPVRSDAPVDFSTKADAFLGAFPTLQAQINSATAWISSQVDTTASDVLASQAARTAAETARNQAQTARNEAVSANTNAQSAKTAAESAKTAAQTAKTAAETARTQAQAARDEAVVARNEAEYWAQQAEATVLDPTMAALIASKAPLESPALTGNPTAPTPAAGDNDTSIATTAHVKAAISLAKQTSPTDTTPGRLMQVGAFGLGAVVLQELTNPDSAPATGFYRLYNSTGMPDLSTWSLLHISRDSGTGRAIQIAWSDNNGGVEWWRIRTWEGVWQPWREKVDTANWYLGTDKLYTANAAGAVNLNAANASIFDLTLTGNVTLSISNAIPPSGHMRSVVIRIRQGATPYTLTWWGGITWLAASTPAAPGANKIVEYVLSRFAEGGWIGRVGAKN